MAVDFPGEIKALRATVESIQQVTDLERLRAEIAELEQQSSAPDLWDDPDAAQQVTSRLSHKQAELDRITGVISRMDDLEIMVELGEAEDDAQTLVEAERELAALTRTVGELEVRTLLNGEFDAREAVITIRSGAGGVDAADFAEMLMRMYLRWAERHGYPTTVMDTSYAEEAGLKSATFEIDAPYAFGDALGRGRHPPPGADLAVRQPGPPADQLRRRRGAARWSSRPTTSTSRRTSSRSTSSAPPARVGRASTPPTPRSG